MEQQQEQEQNRMQKKKSVSRLEFKTSAVKNCTQNRVRGKERVSGKNEQTTIHIMK